ncbi:MAG: amidohydrolase family protein, partial [Chitinispirillaceae bacterium]|nr:amidohydrolase family protein [Chitinispirillaceae bacterium]
EAFDPGEKRDFSQQDDSLYEAPIPLAPLKINPRKLSITEPEAGLEIGKPFETSLDSLLTRTPADRNERVVWLSLWSKYKGKVREMQLAEDAKVDDAGNATVRSPRLPENPDWKNDPNKSPEEPVEYWWRAESKYMDGYFEGEKARWPKKQKTPKIGVFVDCHMHTNPPKSAPLPTVWVQHPLLKSQTPDWNEMESKPWKTLLEVVKHDLPGLADKNAEQLGAMALDESEKVLKDASLNEMMVEPDERKRILVNMPIDIEMAHYWGYDGRPVYEQNEKGELGYWRYEKAGKREWVGLDVLEVEKLQSITKQFSSIQTIASKNSGSFASFFPFDPRHWLGAVSKNSLGVLVEVFENIVQFSSNATKLKKFTAIGFKLYTALGYRPDDYKPRSVTSLGKIPERKTLEAKLPDLADFYTVCESNHIPITCHCSRGGIFAHDFMLYYDYLFGGDDASEKQKKEFFHHHYVSPFAWENVLRDYNELHLCLAHFGGEEEWRSEKGTDFSWAQKCIDLALTYKNFYVDISYFIFKAIEMVDCNKVACSQESCLYRGQKVPRTANCPEWYEEVPAKGKLKEVLRKYPRLKEKILFGTDWYLIGAEEQKYGRYNQYFNRSIKILSEIDKELPAYTMSINPKRFLKLDSVADMMVKKLGQEFGGLKAMVEHNMHDEIGKYYV